METTKAHAIAAKLGLDASEVARIISSFTPADVADFKAIETGGTWESRDLFGDKVAQRRAELAAQRSQ